MKRAMIIAMLMFLPGCGADFFPEQTGLTTQKAGTYIESRRTGSGWTVETTKGAFATYTSMGNLPRGTDAYVDTRTDAQTHYQLGKLLRSGDKVILIRAVLFMDTETPSK